MDESEIKAISDKLHIKPSLVELARKAWTETEEARQRLTAIESVNQSKVLKAFQECKISQECLVSGSGYGYNDRGREGLECVFAKLFGAEAAIVRPQIVSGTHAIAACLYGALRPGQELIAATGKPYDSLWPTIGLSSDAEPNLASAEQSYTLAKRTSQNCTPSSISSLKALGVVYKEIKLKDDGSLDLDALERTITKRTGAVLFQRSMGYQWRKALTVNQIAEAVQLVKHKNPNAVCIVDNCYGEFVETTEPSEHGADLVAGSLIKNPGGGLAPWGGYIVGKKQFVKSVGSRLIAPGLEWGVGSLGDQARLFFQGLFIAPHVVAEALRGAVVSAAIMQHLGFEVLPRHDEPRSDIIQAVKLNSKEAVLAFCRGIQKASAIDSFALPEPAPMPGYSTDVIMAGGTFVQGATLELSADAPVREPYVVYLQGGLTAFHTVIGTLMALQEVLNMQ